MKTKKVIVKNIKILIDALNNLKQAGVVALALIITLFSIVAVILGLAVLFIFSYKF